MKHRLPPHIRPYSRFVALTALLLTVVLFTLTSCSWNKTVAPSVLVIVAEELGFGASSCSEGDANDLSDGFAILCGEAVRFTHAYTPSLMSQAALASIMTGQYPIDHGVRNNGSQFLASKIETAPEVAVMRGYRTAFFGGGPPVWRSSGLNQGFEVFDDSFTPSRKGLYRPAVENIRLFLNWRESEASHKPFFATLHFADGQFPDTPTVNDLGEVRGSNYRGQVDEISESLGFLFRSLKERGAWDDTHVIFAGLNGAALESRIGETLQVNLYSERTRVALFIKPARRRREGSFNWKIDSNVSLADVGTTLYDLFGHKRNGKTDSLETHSLRAIFEKPQPDWQENRLIMSEADWPQWRGQGSRRIALRRGPFLYLNDVRPRLFNTLTDSLETASLHKDDLRYEEAVTPFREFIARHGIPPFTRLDEELTEKLVLGQDLWRSSRPRPDVMARLRALAKGSPHDLQLQSWRALHALRVGEWAELKDAGQKASQPLWTYVAARNLGEKATAPTDSCARLFSARGSLTKKPGLRDCGSQEVLELFQWTDEGESNPRRQQAMERFIRAYSERSLEERIAEQNYVVGLAWDLPQSRPDGPRLADLFLALPEHRRFRTLLERRLSGENK